jgi:steroid delta-isomerase-like uncharacterized protein
MSTQNKAIVRRFIEKVWSKGDFHALDELYADKHIDHTPRADQFGQGRQGARKFISAYRSAFPDTRITIEEHFENDDKVVTRWSAEGTNTGEFMGMPATGKHATMNGVSIDRVLDGKIVESWGSSDRLGLLEQLGVVPKPGQAAQAMTTDGHEYARVTTVQGSPENVDEAILFTKAEIVPAAQQLRGFRSYLGLIDRKSGKATILTFWESEETLRASEEEASRLRMKALPTLGAEAPPTVDRYEVVVKAGPAPKDLPKDAPKEEKPLVAAVR